MTEDSSTRSWDAVAADWVTHADANDYRNHFLIPQTLRLLGDVAGRLVLDLGCGEGGYSRELARRGAQVIGIDGSAHLVEVARVRAREAGLDITFTRLNASALERLGDRSFDLVLAAMVLMDVEDYPAAVGEVARVLAPGGILVMSITHPCFSPRTAEWVRDEAGALRFFAVDRYFDREVWDERMTARFTGPVVRRHRPLADYFASLLANGLILRDFLEPVPAPEDLGKSPRFERLARIPYFLFMRWQKPSVASQ